MEPPKPNREPLVFERRAPSWTLWVCRFGVIAYVVLICFMPAAAGEIAEAFPPGLPVTPFAIMVTLSLFPVMFFGSLLFFVERARRRYGRAQFFGSRVEFTEALEMLGHWKTQTRNLRDIVSRQATPYGVLLTFRREGVFKRVKFIVPAPDDERQAEVIAYLNAQDAG